MGNKTVYSIDLDTTSLVSSYRRALKEMEAAGYSSDALSPINKGLEKLEKQYAKLKQQGEKGFTNGKDIEKYQENVNALVLNFKDLERQFKNLAVDVKDLSGKTKTAIAGLNSIFNSAGFKNIDKVMKNILVASDKQAAVNKEINAELQTRVNILNNIKAREEAIKNQKEAVKSNALGMITDQGVDASGKPLNILAGGGRNASNRADILQKAKELIFTAKTVEGAWKSLNKYITENSLGNALNVANTGAKQFYDNLAAAIEEMKKIKELNAESKALVGERKEAKANARLIGTEDKESGTWKVSAAYMRQVEGQLKNITASYAQLDRILPGTLGKEERINSVLAQQDRILDTLDNEVDQGRAKFNAMAETQQTMATGANKASIAIEGLRQKLLYIFSFQTIWLKIRQEIRKTFTDIQNIDKAFGSIAMVTDKTVKQMWSSYEQYANMAEKLGQSTTDVIQASALFYQQGLDTNEALQLTTDTMKLATLAGSDFSTATKEMTSTLHGFNMEMNEGSHITDVYSELAAHAAASVDEIAKAMERTAAIANSAGMSFENTAVFLTHMLETTQEGAENIGTSLKTIIARFGELKNNVSDVEGDIDSVDLNKVDKALKSVGIQLKDENLQFRNLDEVLLELSSKWSSLDRNTQRYIATIAAGSRQQSRFLALMEGYDRTVELMDTAANSAGKANQQFSKYSDTVEYRINKIKTLWEEFKVSIVDNELWKGMLDRLTHVLEKLSSLNLKETVTTLGTGIVSTVGFVKLLTKQLTDGIGATSKLLEQKPLTIPIKLPMGAITNQLENVKQKIRLTISDALQTMTIGTNAPASGDLFIKQYAEGFKELNVYSDNALHSLIDFYNTMLAAGQTTQGFTAWVNELKNKLGLATLSDEEFSEALRKNVIVATAAERKIDKLNNSASRMEQTLHTGAQGLKVTGKQLVSSLAMPLSTLGMAFTSVVSGITDAETAFKNAALMLIPSFVSLIPQLFVTGEEMGAALAEGAAIGSAGLSVIVTMIAGALALAGWGIAHLVKSQEFNSVEKKLERTKAAAEELEELAQVKTDEAKNAQEEADNVEEIKKRYQELNGIVIKTEEEQEEYNKLIETIRNDFPEIVEYYNEITGELRIQNDLWDDIIKKADTQAKNAKKTAYITAMSELDAKGKLIADPDDTNFNKMSTIAKEVGINNTTRLKDVVKNSELPEYYLDFIKAVMEETGGDVTLAQVLHSADYFTDELKTQYENVLRIYNTGLQTEIEKFNSQYDAAQASKLAPLMDNSLLMAQAVQQSTEIADEEYSINGFDFDTIKNRYPEMVKTLELTKDNWKEKDVEIEQWLKNSDAIDAYLDTYESLTESEIESFKKFDEKWVTYTKGQLEEESEKLPNSIKDATLKIVQDKTEELKDKILESGLLVPLNATYQELQDVYNRYQRVSEAIGSEKATGYFRQMQNAGYNSKIQDVLTSIDFTQLDSSTYAKTKQKTIEGIANILKETNPSIKNAAERAADIWQAEMERGISYGIINGMGVASEAGVDQMQEDAENAINSISESFSGITNALTEFHKKGFLTPNNFTNISKNLREIGLDPNTFLDYNTRSIKDVNELTQAYKDQIAVEIAKMETDLSVAENQLLIMKATQATTDAEKENIKQKETGIKALKSTIESMKGYAEGAYLYIDEALATTMEDETDAEKNAKNYEKALEDLAKAQEDVAEKQKDLNEKIKEYNDLLNGSENRKSSLDNLYNYNEALSSFNDELSRAKDIVEDANTIDSAIDAMSRYGAATKQLIAEEKAKQEAIKAGLNNYGNMIENGTYAYTNSQTGETTNINFGNYARKDARTGKYMLDQRLLNEARFSDKFKDLIEQQVSEYNKYADELLKSEDNVRKAEKDIQKEREDALKKYVALETQLAEALKKQYEDEVNDQKSKYDDLKKQDDDYLDALKDAIDKQKKLREQENKWEELAQQEKKLSLMRRDTSGANAKEVASLEKDVEKSREDMLNDAIDNVVDNLEKLYESQEELRNEEIELKEAVKDNTAYWNAKAESMIQSFDNAEEYAQYISSISKEYADMTLAMQQEKLAEYASTYEEATEYMALQAMDAVTETGDYIVEMTTVTGQEVTNIVNQTGEAFTQEVIRQFNETTEAFTQDMKKAAEAIDAANKALQEAYQKLADCAEKVNELAGKLGAGGQGGGGSTNPGNAESDQFNALPIPNADSIGNLVSTLIGAYDHSSQENVDNLIRDIFAATGDPSSKMFTTDMMKKIYEEDGKAYRQLIDFLGIDTKDMLNYGVTAVKASSKFKLLFERKRNKFADGGLVNYTGPAWVDGSYSKPEAFLSAEDTARIGEAAKILADLPWLGSNPTQTITNNRGGDVAVEINLNIDKLSSDVDVDNMIERVKKEIVDVSRPIGSPTILQQN